MPGHISVIDSMHDTTHRVDVNSADIKIFLTYLIIMGLVKTLRIGDYWSTSNFCKTPLFSKHMSYNLFKALYGTVIFLKMGQLDSKRRMPSRACKECNFTQWD